jgi:NAD-dependent DNA ligase
MVSPGGCSVGVFVYKGEIKLGLFSKLFGQSSSDTEPIDIVGESFYKESFKALRNQLGAKVGDRMAVRVELRVETDNPYGVKGKAVAAFVNGMPVGHVSNSQVIEAFNALSAEGGNKTVSGSVYFADLRESVARNSVLADYRVNKYVPPVPSAEAVAKKAEQEKLNLAGLADLRKKGWSQFKVEAGNKICFTMFNEISIELEALARKNGLEVINNVVKTLDLLVINQDFLEESSKALKAIQYGISVTNLETFLKVNPDFKPTTLR